MPVPEGLSGLIATAVTPVALVTPCAILLSAYFNKHAGLSGQARDLTAELRQDTTGYARVLSLVKQVQWFQRRVNLVWG